jgi:hypothetical protein
MDWDNSVTVSGLLHHVRNGKKNDQYFLFSVKQESPWIDGTVRKDFLLSRAFLPDVRKRVESLPEGTPLEVIGSLQSSLGSGDLYIYAREIRAIPDAQPAPEKIPARTVS